MLNKRLITVALLAYGGFFCLSGLVLLALGVIWAFWVPALIVGALNLLAALLFARSR
jgi:hypothetical protein